MHVGEDNRPIRLLKIPYVVCTSLYQGKAYRKRDRELSAAVNSERQDAVRLGGKCIMLFWHLRKESRFYLLWFFRYWFCQRFIFL